ncbi:MFS transporter [Deinococcus sp. PESE-13]
MQSENTRFIGLLSFLTLFVIGTDTFLVAPLLPILRGVLHIGVATSGWLVSAYAIGYVLAALIAGPISDRQNRKTVLLAGLAAFALFTAACGLVSTFPAMLLARFAAGGAAAFVTPQIWASIPELVPAPRILPVMGLATAGLATAQLAGIPIGSFLAALDWRFSFLAVAVVAGLLWLVLARLFPSVPTRNRGFVGYRSLLQRKNFSLALAAYFTFQTGNFAAFSFIGSWLAHTFGFTVKDIGWAMLVIGAGNMLGSLAGPRVTRGQTERRILLLGLGGMALCYVLTPWAAQASLAVAGLSLCMTLAGAVFPTLMNAVVSRAAEARGTASALANAAMYTGVTVGAALGGLLFARYGFRGPAWLMVLLDLLALSLFTVLLPATEQKQGQSR